jgi:hypothetical protein
MQKRQPDILRVSAALQEEMGLTLERGTSTKGMKAGEKPGVTPPDHGLGDSQLKRTKSFGKK